MLKTETCLIFFFSIKNERADIDSLSLSTAPEEGLTLQAQGVYLDYAGKVHYEKKLWYVLYAFKTDCRTNLILGKALKLTFSGLTQALRVIELSSCTLAPENR